MYLFKEYQFMCNKILHLLGFRYTVKDITISKAQVSFWLAEPPALFHYSLLKLSLPAMVLTFILHKYKRLYFWRAV